MRKEILAQTYGDLDEYLQPYALFRVVGIVMPTRDGKAEFLALSLALSLPFCSPNVLIDIFGGVLQKLQPAIAKTGLVGTVITVHTESGTKLLRRYTLEIMANQFDDFCAQATVPTTNGKLACGAFGKWYNVAP